jgi:hypothetical protein
VKRAILIGVGSLRQRGRTALQDNMCAVDRTMLWIVDDTLHFTKHARMQKRGWEQSKYKKKQYQPSHKKNVLPAIKMWPPLPFRDKEETG